MIGEVSLTDTRSTYDAASGHFDAAPLGFWERYGERTVARLVLSPGARVLDVCCGTGASALHAARAVGESGSVVGVDLSEPLLALARQKAREQRLDNVLFRAGDMGQLDLPDESFDAVVIVFGIFFAPDMALQIETLARLVRPGGVLALTTWGPRLFAPLYQPFLHAVRRRRPGTSEYRPWDRLSTEADVAALLRAAGLASFEISAEAGSERLEHAEHWWTVVLGTGLRWFVDQLDAASAETLRAECLAHAREARAIETNVVYSVARKPF
jgi:ubiquinone/menaquinone biosynthesis C-methylase UbiE